MFCRYGVSHYWFAIGSCCTHSVIFTGLGPASSYCSLSCLLSCCKHHIFTSTSQKARFVICLCSLQTTSYEGLRERTEHLDIFRSTSKSRPNNIRGGKNVRPYVRTSVCPSTKSFFDFNEIWYVGRGRWVMHGRMAGSKVKVKVTSPSKFQFLPFSKPITPPFTMAAGKWPLKLKLEHNI